MHNKRKNYFIDRGFQTKFILKFCIIVFITSLAIGASLFILSSSSTTVAIENTKVSVKTTADFLLPFIVQTVLVVTLFSATLVILLTLFVSHKISGPLYRLKKEIDKFAKGDFNANFHIRMSDQLKDLSYSLTSMADFFRDKISLIEKLLAEERKILENSSFEDKKQVESKIKQIEKLTADFKGL